MAQPKIEKVIYDPGFRSSVRELIAKLKGQIELYTNHGHNTDGIQKLVHEIEFDFFGCYFTHEQYKIIDQAREILEKNKDT